MDETTSPKTSSHPPLADATEPQWGHMNKMGSGLPLKPTPAWCLEGLHWHNLQLLPEEGTAAGAIPRGAAGEGRSHCIPHTPSTAGLWFLRGVWVDDGSIPKWQAGLRVLSPAGTVLGEEVFVGRAAQPQLCPSFLGKVSVSSPTRQVWEGV